MIPRGTKIHSAEVLGKRRRRLRLRLFGFIFFILLIAGGVVGFFYIPQITIAHIKTEGSETLTNEDIVSIANRALSGSYYYLFPKRNIFLYPKNEIEKEIMNNPRVVNTSVSFLDFKSIVVTIKERKPHSLWCGQEIYSGEDKGRCFFVDDGGFVFAKAPDFSGTTFLRIFGGGDTRDPVGNTVIDEPTYKTIIFFKKEVDEKVAKINRLHFKPNNIVDLYFEDGGKLIITSEQNLSKALSNVVALVSGEGFSGKDSRGNLSIEYIDLQNPDKVFYKVKK